MAFRDKAARSAYNKRWREENAQQLVQKKLDYYRKNRDSILEKQRVYKAALPREVLLERRRRHYEAHLARQKKRYHQTRAWLPWLNALTGSKARAKKHGIQFTITKEWASERWTGKCEVTGIEFILSTRRNPYFFSPSIDRIIPSLGYTPENSRFVLHAVNALKGAGTDEDMLLVARAIVINHKI